MIAGKKTYIMAACIALVSIAKQMGWVDLETYLALLGILNGGGLAALRDGIKNG